MTSPTYTLEMFIEHFRAICDAVILYCVREKTQKTQAASLLLDHGNSRFAALDRSGRALCHNSAMTIDIVILVTPRPCPSMAFALSIAQRLQVLLSSL